MLVLAFFLLVPTAQAIRVTDNLAFTIPPNSTECIDIYLPDDAGIGAAEKTEFILGSNASWGDVSEQIVRTDENNTGLIPVCFRSYGIPEGNCSAYKINISTPSKDVFKEYKGSSCVSSLPDIDTPASLPGSVGQSFDLFSVGFASPVKYAKPGEAVTFTAYAESQAALQIQLTLSGGLAFDSTSKGVQTPGLQEANFTATAPQEEGRYQLKLEGQASCTQAGCLRQATTELVVSESDQEGFSVSLFPYNLDVKSLDPVRYKATITNHGSSQRLFETSAEFAEGLQSAFPGTTILVDAGGTGDVEFTATPTKASSLYEIMFTASSNGLEKKASAYMTTNEMLTDALREQRQATDKEAAQEAVDSWYDVYKTSAYGEDLEKYEEMKAKIEAAKQGAEQEQRGPVPPQPPAQQPVQAQDNTLLYIGVAVAAIGIIAGVLLMRRKPKAEGIEYK